MVLLDELEEQCAQAEVALRARDWKTLEQRLFDQRRTRQAIVNDLARESTAAQAIPDVFARLQAIFAFRADQLRRLTAYRNDLSERLRTTRKWKDATRSARKGIGPAATLISKIQ